MVEDREMVYFALPPGDEVLHLQLPKSATAIEKAIHAKGPFGSSLDEAARWISKNLEGLAEPGLHFHIAPRPDDDLLHGHNLHLYASAVVDRVKSVSGTQFSCVTVTKGHTSPTALYVASSVLASAPTDCVTVTFKTRKSYAKPDFTRAVYEATHAIRSVAAFPGPLRLHVSYLTGLPRSAGVQVDVVDPSRSLKRHNTFQCLLAADTGLAKRSFRRACTGWSRWACSTPFRPAKPACTTNTSSPRWDTAFFRRDGVAAVGCRLSFRRVRAAAVHG
jgi:hypothetical protein